MRKLSNLRTLFSILILGAIFSGPAAAALKSEQLEQSTLPSHHGPHWVWVNDVSFARMIDGRAYLLDADTGRFLGMLSAGYSHGTLQLAPDNAVIADAETYYSRGSRGKRTDVLTFYNPSTLSPAGEVVLPPKRYIGLPFIGTATLTDDGKYSLIYNFTPDQSISVVDIHNKKFVGEFPTPGCGLIYPTGPQHFFMQCGYGSLQAGNLDKDGKITLGHASKQLFSKNDPAAEKPVRIDKTHWLFFTYGGTITVVDGSGDIPAISEQWNLRRAAAQGLRVGGLQPLAFHASTDRLYILLHKGKPDTTKDPGTEIWVYNIKNQRRVSRIKLEGPAISIAVSQDDKPLLYAVMLGSGKLNVYDAMSGKKLRSIDNLGDSLTFIQPVGAQ